MKISVRNLYRILVLSMVILYSFIVFMVTKTFTTNFWINYFFVILSPIVVFCSTFVKDSPSKGSFPFNVVYMKYFISYALIEFILGTVLMYTTLKLKYIFLIQIPIIIVFTIIIVFFSIGVTSVKENLRIQTEKVNYLSIVRIKLNTIKNSSDNNEIKKELDKIIDEVQYSDYNSCDEVYSIEQRMLAVIEQMALATVNEQYTLIKKLKVLLSERNQTILLMKRR